MTGLPKNITETRLAEIRSILSAVPGAFETPEGGSNLGFSRLQNDEQRALNSEYVAIRKYLRDRKVKIDEARESLLIFIRSSVNELVRASNAPELFTVERVDQMAYALTRFVVNSTEKYINGQIEHGSNAVDGLETRDLHREREQEIQDLFWYETAETWKK